MSSTSGIFKRRGLGPDPRHHHAIARAQLPALPSASKTMWPSPHRQLVVRMLVTSAGPALRKVVATSINCGIVSHHWRTMPSSGVDVDVASLAV